MITLADDSDNSIREAQSNLRVSVDTTFRIVTAAILIASIGIEADVYQLLTPRVGAFLVIALIYIALCFLFTYRKPPKPPNPRLQSAFAHIDALALGAATAGLGFAPLPLVILASLTLVRAVATGGLWALFTHAAAFAVGTLLVITANHPQVALQAGSSMNTVGLVAAPLFLCFLSYVLFRRQNTLSGELSEAQQQIVDLKLTNYKLSKYLSPTLRKAISSGKGVKLETQRKKITIFFSDIRGFSELSEKLETETLTELLNHYLTEMSDIALKFGGTVDKFIGDGIMVFFGDPVSRGAKADCVACVSMAIAMQKRMQELRQRWQAQGLQDPLHVRMGINSGFCTVGNFGTENRLDYTLLGTEVNLASRLESAADPGEILISPTTYDLVKDVILCREKGEYQLKGIKEPVLAYSVVDLRKNLGKADSYVEHTTEGFSMYLDLDKVKDYEKQKVISSLEQAYKQLKREAKTPRTQET